MLFISPHLAELPLHLDPFSDRHEIESQNGIINPAGNPAQKTLLQDLHYKCFGFKMNAVLNVQSNPVNEYLTIRTSYIQIYPLNGRGIYYGFYPEVIFSSKSEPQLIVQSN